MYYNRHNLASTQEYQSKEGLEILSQLLYSCKISMCGIQVPSHHSPTDAGQTTDLIIISLTFTALVELFLAYAGAREGRSWSSM